MTIQRYLLPALAVVNAVYGQCSVKNGGTTTISTAAEATGVLQGCSIFKGSIELASDTSGDIDLSTVETFQGSLIGKNVSQMTSLTAGYLSTVTENFQLTGLTTISMMSFPQLSEVYNLDWDNFGQNIEQLPFTNLLQVNSFSLTNTFFTGLTGLAFSKADNVVIANNNYLTEVNLPLSNVTGNLILNSNGNTLTASFPDLISVSYMSLSNCTSINLPKLNVTTETGGIFFVGNSITELKLPKLNYTAAFTANGNHMLNAIDVPLLTTVNGAINVNNNSALTGTINFPSLEYVKGRMNFVGDYSAVTIPKLLVAKAGMFLESTKNIQNSCNHFSGESGRGNVIQGSVNCVANAATSAALPSATGGSGGATSSPTKGAASHYESSAGATYGIFAFLAAAVGMLM